MQNNSYELVLQLVDNENFKSGAIDKVKIVITDQLVKPDYWVWDPYDPYLGSYSSMKFRLWLEFMTDDNIFFHNSSPFYFSMRLIAFCAPATSAIFSSAK